VNGTITKYVYDNEDIIAEYDGNNQLIASYTHGPGIDEPISMTNGQTYYYHADALGSIIAITNSTGNVVQRYEYDSFGNIVSVLDPNFKQPYTYTAREYDEETGLYYYRARYYDAEVGRFISEDPIRFDGGINFFAYVGNNPVNQTDPEGLSVFPPECYNNPNCFLELPKKGDKCYKCDWIAILQCISKKPATPPNAMACARCILSGGKDKNACSQCVGSLAGNLLDCIDRTATKVK